MESERTVVLAIILLVAFVFFFVPGGPQDEGVEKKQTQFQRLARSSEGPGVAGPQDISVGANLKVAGEVKTAAAISRAGIGEHFQANQSRRYDFTQVELAGSFDARENGVFSNHSETRCLGDTGFNFGQQQVVPNGGDTHLEGWVYKGEGGLELSGDRYVELGISLPDAVSKRVYEQQEPRGMLPGHFYLLRVKNLDILVNVLESEVPSPQQTGQDLWTKSYFAKCRFVFRYIVIEGGVDGLNRALRNLSS